MFILAIIIKAIFFGSLIGMLVIFYSKAPLLANLPKTSPVFETRKRVLTNFLETAKERIKSLPFLKGFSFEILLQKILSKVRIFTLRTESRVSGWLESLRARAKKKDEDKKVKNDNYWEKLETEKDEKDLPR
ncbi:hypothetical protein KKH63_02055 [Patescibacteria group bacterium]|nr:hypothetical protein [Patescibacteria group bacterium]